MSGGSYNCLYAKETDDLLDGVMNDDLAAMERRLRSRGNIEAADATLTVINAAKELALARERLEKIVYEQSCALFGVWRAVEMCDSNDGDEGDIDNAINRYMTSKATEQDHEEEEKR